MIVIDCSIAICWTLNDEHSDYATKVLEYVMKQDVECMVPTHFLLEMLSALQSAYHRKRITKNDMSDARNHWLNRTLEFVEINHEAVGALMDQHQLTAYDAAYLELAVRRKLPLATLDKNLAKAAKKEKRVFVV